MRIRNLWMAPLAAAALVLAGCPGGEGTAAGAGDEPATGAETRPGMDFEVTVDTQRIGGPDAATPATPAAEAPDGEGEG